MNIRCASFASLAALAALSSACSADDNDLKNEMKKLGGVWQLVSGEQGDTKLPEEVMKDFRLTFKGNAFRCTNGGSILYEGTYKVIEVKGKIRKSDASYTKGDHFSGKTIPQLAEWLDDDTFRVCIPDPMLVKELKRPTEITAKKESGQAVFVFRRDDAAKKERERLQGAWVLVSGEMEGEKLSEEQVKKAPKSVLVFAGESVSLRKYARGEDAPPQVLFKGTFKLDPSENPKTIDITITEDISENLNKGQVVPGIYELTDDTLRWCAPEPGSKGDRPKEFSTKPGTKHMLSVLKREKR